MRRYVVSVVLLLLLTSAVYGGIELYLAPNGGWDKENNKRTIAIGDGKEVEWSSKNGHIFKIPFLNIDFQLFPLVFYNLDMNELC